MLLPVWEGLVWYSEGCNLLQCTVLRLDQNVWGHILCSAC